MKLFLSIQELSAEQQQRVQSLLVNSPMVMRENYDDDAPLEAGFSNCDIVFGNVPANWLTDNTRVRWVQLDSVGFGEYRMLDWPRLGQQMCMTNLAGFFADPVAQTALAGILALYRGLDVLVDCRRDHTWVGDPLRASLRTLTGNNVVLFGRGAINQRLGSLLSAFDCTISSFGRDWTPEQLDHAIQLADVVVSTVPETDSTIATFDRRRLGLMQAHALFVNCGRGSVVDETALIEYLEAHSLGGAVIDVTNDEPLPAGHGLWSAPNTLLTQHSGGGTQDELDRKIDVFEYYLAQFRQGKSLMNIVDFDRGY